jgi:acyl carrier protein
LFIFPRGFNLILKLFFLGTSFDADWNTLEIPDNKIEVAKIIITTMSEITGASVEDITENLNNSFFNVGGSSLNSIQVIVKLRELKVFISIPGFVGAKTIRDIVDIANLIKDADEEEEGEEENGLSVYKEAENIYDFNYLTDADKDDTCQ